MKKISLLFLALATSVFADVKADSVSALVKPALGSAENPVLIENAQDLARLRDVLNAKIPGVFRGIDMSGNARGVYFKQTADIDLSELCVIGDCNWIPFERSQGIMMVPVMKLTGWLLKPILPML